MTKNWFHAFDQRVNFVHVGANPKVGLRKHQSLRPIGPAQPLPVPIRHRTSVGCAQAASGMATTGEAFHRDAIGFNLSEGPQRKVDAKGQSQDDLIRPSLDRR